MKNLRRACGQVVKSPVNDPMKLDSPGLVIGCGAGFAGDRHDAADAVIEALAAYNCPRFLIYEVLAERTLAIAQRLKLADPSTGYSPWLHKYLGNALPKCLDNDVKIIANFGSANPQAAAQEVLAIANAANCRTPRIAFIEGDDLLQNFDVDTLSELDCIEGTSIAGRELIAANAYLGASGIRDALALQADIVLVGRTTDSALAAGAIANVLNIPDDDFDAIASAVLGGHLIECGSQITGGYFADPGCKPVNGLADTGFPLLEVYPQGDLVVTKPADTGGLVNPANVIEQLLYEIHDPSSYLTPDVILDVSDVEVHQLSNDRVHISGARGRKPTDTLKVTLSLDGGWLGEGEISYVGLNALARARLAEEILRERLLGDSAIDADALINADAFKNADALRIDVIGTRSVFNSNTITENTNLEQDDSTRHDQGEYRVRAALTTYDRNRAEHLTDEVLTLYCCGPAGGCGVRQSVVSRVSTASVLIDRTIVESHVQVKFLNAG